MSDVKTLNFVETYTPEQFKQLQAVDVIKIKKNDSSGKLFFTFGTKSGAISKAMQEAGKLNHPMISLVNTSLDRMPTNEEMQFIGKSVKTKDAAGNIITTDDPRAKGFFFMMHEENDNTNVIATL